MNLFSTPRPSGGPAELKTLRSLQRWLHDRNLPYNLHSFKLYPYSNELIGGWLLASALLLTLTVVFRWHWLALLLVAAAMAAVIVNVVLSIPTVAWPIERQGTNVLVTFEPPQAEQMLIIATHYDSKTELFDHKIQGFFLSKLNLCIKLAAAVLAIGLIDRLGFAEGSFFSTVAQIAGVALVLPVLLVVGAVGANLIPGRWIEQSQGAVDNGAACAILLGLSERLAQTPEAWQRTRVVLAFFAGEEVSMQGSRAYVRERLGTLPTVAVNLELMGQNGPYVYWRSEGNVLTSAPTDARLNTAVSAVVQEVTGQPAQPVGGINSDGYSFIQAGIPTCVLGSHDRELGGGMLHRPTDNLARVDLTRLPESVEILTLLAQRYDEGTLIEASGETESRELRTENRELRSEN